MYQKDYGGKEDDEMRWDF